MSDIEGMKRKLERLMGLKRGTVRRGAQPQYELPLDESIPLPDLTLVLDGFGAEFVKTLSRLEIDTLLDELLVHPVPIVCRGCGLQLYWGTSIAEIEKEGNPYKLAPYEYLYCIPCEAFYPLNDMPFMMKQFVRNVPDLERIKEEILGRRPKELTG